MKNLVSVTAPPWGPQGKLARMLLNQIPRARMVETITTKALRSSDELPGEYCSVSSDEFDEMNRNNLFVWTTEQDGYHYGVMSETISTIFEFRDTLGIIILSLESVPWLWRFLEKIGKDHRYAPIFLLPPEQIVLEQQLRERGESEERIAADLVQGHNFIRKVGLSGIPFRYLYNKESIESSFYELGNIIGV